MPLEVIVSFSEDLLNEPDFTKLEQLYTPNKLVTIFLHVFEHLATQPSVKIPSELGQWLLGQNKKPCEIELYITDPVEAQAINLDARGKDYATNILSYPSELHESVIKILPSIPLGELVICHEVVAKQAAEQGKTLQDHVTHLLVHGVLHLLGFDHELGQAQQDVMESVEISVLANLGVANPYE